MKLHFVNTREIDSEKTGAEISDARGDITQAAIAAQMGITASYLCDLEKGRRAWTADLHARACAALKKLAP